MFARDDDPEGYEDEASSPISMPFGIPTPPAYPLPPNSESVGYGSSTTSTATRSEDSSSVTNSISSTTPQSAQKSSSSGTSSMITRTSSTATSINSLPTSLPTGTETGTNSSKPYYDNDGNVWTKLDHNAQHGIVAAIVIGALLVAFFSYWLCCGGRRAWSEKKQRGSNGLPLHETSRQPNANGQQMREVGAGADAPPKYEEAVPPEHHRLAGGIVGARNEEEDGMIADGKMPLSEMPFEDVVVVDDHTSVSSSTAVSDGSWTSARHHSGTTNATS